MHPGEPVSFSEPFTRAWERMNGILFRPPSLRVWLTLGFTSWLAELGARAGQWGANASDDGFALDDWGRSGGEAWREALADSLLLALGAFGCLVVFVMAIAVVWLSSRGKFMFLDNVVHRRALVIEPWHRYRRQSNSLFIYQICFFVVCVFAFGSLFAIVAGAIGATATDAVRTTFAVVPLLAAGGALFLGGFLVLFAIFFVDAFVVPLMHRYDLGILEGWGRFLDIFRPHAVGFVLCGLLVFVTWVILGTAIVIFGFLTCCLGFILLVIPYVSSVVLLPFTTFYRSFTFEFLAQFDPDLKPSEETPTPPPVPPPPPVPDPATTA